MMTARALCRLLMLCHPHFHLPVPRHLRLPNRSKVAVVAVTMVTEVVVVVVASLHRLRLGVRTGSGVRRSPIR